MASGVLLAGHRRLIAALAAGLETVRVIITDRLLSDSEIRVIQLTENMHRADLSGYEKWLACEELMSMKPQWQQRDLAHALHISEKMVTVNLSPSRCAEAWQEALRAKKVGISDCYAASKLGSPEEQDTLLAFKLSGGEGGKKASRDTIEQAGRKSRKGKPAAIKLARVKISMPQKAKKGQRIFTRR